MFLLEKKKSHFCDFSEGLHFTFPIVECNKARLNGYGLGSMFDLSVSVFIFLLNYCYRCCVVK